MASRKSSTADALVKAAAELRDAVSPLKFDPPVAHVYNPLDYAWAPHEAYLRTFGASPKRAVFFGMNPGPFGMVQTGVPFGEVAAVRDWLGINCAVGAPANPHPKRPVTGFACVRSEVSGQRLWGLFAARFGQAGEFFADHFVANYCPLAFCNAEGANLTPDKFPADEGRPLLAACDAHLRRVVEILRPRWVIGVGDFASRRVQAALEGMDVTLGRILHPSPASPAANRGWAEQATAQLLALGVWT